MVDAPIETLACLQNIWEGGQRLAYQLYSWRICYPLITPKAFDGLLYVPERMSEPRSPKENAKRETASHATESDNNTFMRTEPCNKTSDTSVAFKASDEVRNSLELRSSKLSN